jgi:hypothetical protein
MSSTLYLRKRLIEALSDAQRFGQVAQHVSFEFDDSVDLMQTLARQKCRPQAPSIIVQPLQELVLRTLHEPSGWRMSADV